MVSQQCDIHAFITLNFSVLGQRQAYAYQHPVSALERVIFILTGYQLTVTTHDEL
jgi:hypothetical protein